MATSLTFWSEITIPVVSGDQDAWGTVLNSTLSAWDRHLGGVLSKSLSSGNVTLSSTESQYGFLVATGSPASARTLTIASKPRRYVVRNAFSTAFAVTISTGAGTGVAVPQGTTVSLHCDGTDCYAHGTPTTTTTTLASIPNGSAGNPGLAFSGFSGTGWRGISGGIAGALNAGFDSIRFLAANSASSPLIAGTDSGSSYGAGIYFPSNSSMAFTTSSTERARFDSSGFFMISRTSASANNEGAYFRPTGQLVIENNGATSVELNRFGSTGSWMKFYSGSTAVMGSINQNGSGASFVTTSDRRAKTNIRTVREDLGRVIDALPVVKFAWKNDPQQRLYTGFIAQDVHALVPEAASGDPEGQEMMGVDLGRLVPFLWWAAKDARRRLERLEQPRHLDAAA